MNNNKLLKVVLAKETIFVLGLTLLGYCSVFSLETGFASYYGFSIYFIDIGMINIFENIMVRIFPPAIAVYLYAIYGTEYMGGRIVKLIGIVVTFVVSGYFTHDLYSSLVYAVLFVFLFLFYIIFFNQTKKINNSSDLFFITVVAISSICIIFHFYGRYSASTVKEYNFFNYNNKTYAVLKIYNNSIIANEIINGSLSKNILYIPSNKTEIIELKPFQRIEKN